MCLLAATIIGGYELVRSASSGLLLQTHGADGLGQVWLVVALATGLAVVVYNRVFGTRHRLFVLAIVASLSALVIGMLAEPAGHEIRWATGALFVVKEIYIVVVLETFWSHANVRYPLKSARWLYGVFLFCGSLGGALGSASVSWASKQSLPLPSILQAAAVLLGIVAALAAWGFAVTPNAMPAATPTADAKMKTEGRLGEGFARVAKSRYLLGILLVVGLSQVVLTLIDFHFQKRMGLELGGAAEKAGWFATTFLVINILALSVQVLSGLVLKFAGVPRVLVGVVVLVGAGFVLSTLVESLWFATGALVLAKVLDYSISRAAKELCYIPLSVEAKTLGKPVIDMFAYRFAKGFASIQLMGAVALAVWAPLVATLVALLAWGWVAFDLGRRFQRKV